MRILMNVMFRIWPSKSGFSRVSIVAVFFCLGFGLCVNAQDDKSKSVLKDSAPAENKTASEVDEYKKADLPPLKRIVMYNSGVGQMQHAGVVDGKQRMEIRFGNHDVNDVLKSIVFEDKGGGMVKAVEYQPAPEPEDVAANQIGEPMTLAQLLQRFRGESVELKVGDTVHKGIIYGVENRTVDNQIVETVILMNEGGIQAVALADVDRTQFAKEELRKELGLALAGLVKLRKTNTQQLDILLDGEGKRDVQFAYVVDIPIWRMTYRLALDGDKAVLQGWAHIDNITGVDWKDVEIELRSGKPQAFHINIFSPLMAARPKLGNAIFDFTQGLALIQQMFGGGPSENEPSAGGFGGGGFGLGGLGGGGGGGFGGGGFGGGKRKGSGGVDITTAFRSAATEGRASQMVTYQLDKLVSLGAGKSAALPVFTEQVPVRRMSVYEDDGESSVVLRSLEITNNSKSPIVSGPISIVGAGDFVGDAKLGRLSVGESIELVYGVDRAVEVTRKDHERKSTLQEVRIVEKRLEIIHLIETGVEFQVENKDIEKRKVVVHFPTSSLSLDHAALDDMGKEKSAKVFNPQPNKMHENRLTYEVDVEPQATKPLVISAKVKEKSKRNIDSITRESIEEWQKEKVKISDSDLAFFNKMVESNDAIQQVKRIISDKTGQIVEIEQDQTRIRKNLEVLDAKSEAGKSFVNQLQKQEQQIQELKAQIKSERERLATLEKERQSEINKLGN